MDVTDHPNTVNDVCDIIRQARQSETAVFPIGGGTSLDFGVTPRGEGIGMQLTNLNRVVDYPAADMTITVEAGITMADLRDQLAANRQQLPLDVPQRDTATLGGVLATDFSGPRRYGFGTARDYLIGVSAIDGRGDQFAGGGRVVKNVAGYDFCKMLIGSLGTLGVITEVTLKVKPLNTAQAAMVIAPRDLDHVESVLAQLPHTKTQPVAIEWLTGSAWQAIADEQDWPATNGAGWLLVAVEGTDVEVDAMQHVLREELERSASVPVQALTGPAYKAAFVQLQEFPATPNAPFVIKAGVRPSQTVEFVKSLRDVVGTTADDNDSVSIQLTQATESSERRSTRRRRRR